MAVKAEIQIVDLGTAEVGPAQEIEILGLVKPREVVLETKVDSEVVQITKTVFRVSKPVLKNPADAKTSRVTKEWNAKVDSVTRSLHK